MTLQFFDILLSSPFRITVIEHLFNCQSITQHYILQAKVMHSVRVQLEEDTISYLSLIPEYISSSQSADEDLKNYMQEAQDKVKINVTRTTYLMYFPPSRLQEVMNVATSMFFIQQLVCLKLVQVLHFCLHY